MTSLMWLSRVSMYVCVCVCVCVCVSLEINLERCYKSVIREWQGCDQLDVVITGQHDVRRLEVPMHYAGPKPCNNCVVIVTTV
jgi:hypothetical protein